MWKIILCFQGHLAVGLLLVKCCWMSCLSQYFYPSQCFTGSWAYWWIRRVFVFHVFLPNENPQSFIDITTTTPSDGHLYAKTEDHETLSYPSSRHRNRHRSRASNRPLPEVVNQMLEVKVDLNDNVRDMAHSLRSTAATLQKLVID